MLRLHTIPEIGQYIPHLFREKTYIPGGSRIGESGGGELITARSTTYPQIDATRKECFQ
jgi:hypothetical protein